MQHDSAGLAYVAVAAINTSFKVNLPEIHASGNMIQAES